MKKTLLVAATTAIAAIAPVVSAAAQDLVNSPCPRGTSDAKGIPDATRIAQDGCQQADVHHEPAEDCLPSPAHDLSIPDHVSPRCGGSSSPVARRSVARSTDNVVCRRAVRTTGAPALRASARARRTVAGSRWISLDAGDTGTLCMEAPLDTKKL